MGFWDKVNINKKFKEGSINSNEIKFKNIENIDEDGIGVKFNGETSYSINDIESMFPTFNNVNYRVLIFWDDCVQFSGIGMLDKINTELYDDDEFTYGTLSYLERDVEYTKTIDAVYEILKFYKEFRVKEAEDYCEWKKITGSKRADLIANHKKRYTVTKEELEIFYKNNYFDILRHAPFNGILTAVLNCIVNFNEATIVFDHDFDQAPQLISELNQKVNIRNKCNLSYCTRDNMSIDDILLKYNPNVIFTLNCGEVWESILKLGLSKIEIFTNEIHNGLSDQFIYLLNELSDGKKGPNQCILYTYTDAINVKIPEENKK